MTGEEAIKNIKEHCYFANLIPRAKEALDMAIEALDQEHCDDAISRQAVLDVIEREEFKGDAISEIEKLPPVTPQQKMGKWIYHDLYIPYKHECSECGKRFGTDFNYCQNCGADMRGDTE